MTDKIQDVWRLYVSDEGPMLAMGVEAEEIANGMADHIDALEGRLIAYINDRADLIKQRDELAEALRDLLGDPKWGCDRPTYIKAKKALAKWEKSDD